MGHRSDADFQEFRGIFADPERRAAFFADSSLTIPDETAAKLLADDARLRVMYDRIFSAAPGRPPTARELRIQRWRRREKWLYLAIIPAGVLSAATAAFWMAHGG